LPQDPLAGDVSRDRAFGLSWERRSAADWKVRELAGITLGVDKLLEFAAQIAW